MIDFLTEIFATLRANKLRTFLTGFSVAWGIFMLIVLLGAGNGLRNGVTSNFSNRAKNMISFWPGSTSIPYEGLPIDRQIKFDNRDLALLSTGFPEIQYVSGRIEKSTTITYEKEYGSWSIMGVHPDAQYLNNIQMMNNNGRFINTSDNVYKRKVIIISPEMKTTLFHDADPIGKYINIDNLVFQVVGVYSDEGSRSNSPAYIPFATAQLLFSSSYGIERLDFSVTEFKTAEEGEELMTRIKKQLAALHRFNYTDRSALYIWNTAEDARETNSIFNVIQMFLWIVGIASLMSGVVGVSNIMLITVKERTREFGIRKALGAKPYAILRLIILESILVTAVFGYVGIIFGVGLTEGVSFYMDMTAGVKEEQSFTMFKDPTVNLGIMLGATIVLIVAGVLAGYFPAKKAVSISAIEAMRAE